MSSPLPAPPAPADQHPSETPPKRRRRRIAHRGKINFLFAIGMLLVAGWTSLGHDRARVVPLLISLWPSASAECLIEVRHGEIWRLLTPAFVHFGLVHLGINLLAMATLGGPLERVQGRRFYLGFAAVVALASNLGEYFVSGHGKFGGMSGVIFGWFGFVVLRARCDREYLLDLHPWSIILTMVFFGVGLSNVLPIANTAHAVGLVIGAVWGAASGLSAVKARAAAVPPVAATS